MKKKNVYIADDHRILRDALKLILSSLSNFKVIGEAEDGKQALKEVLEKKPDILLLDISMPSMIGIDVAKEVYSNLKTCKIIILTKYSNIEYLRTLLDYKICAYILKDDAVHDLSEALSQIDEEEIYISPIISKKMKPTFLETLRQRNSKKKKSLLTKRELEITKLIAEDKTTDEIAKILSISPKTVKVHRSNIFEKLRITSVTELVKYALQNHLIDL